jgi:hypothetical protein
MPVFIVKEKWTEFIKASGNKIGFTGLMIRLFYGLAKAEILAFVESQTK